MTDKLSEIFDVTPVAPTQLPIVSEDAGNKRVVDDADMARGNIKQLIDTAKTALQHALDVAIQSESPRAYEVLANLITTSADLNSKLIDIHSQEKKINTTEKTATTQPSITNNTAIFTGTSADLNAMLTQKLKGTL